VVRLIEAGALDTDCVHWPGSFAALVHKRRVRDEEEVDGGTLVERQHPRAGVRRTKTRLNFAKPRKEWRGMGK
jgi:hypothetical protein